jgi:tubulin polyglutamylase TTLL6/13
MQTYQRVNHFAGMQVIARKNLLAKNLQAMQRKSPEEYDFFPPTWILP